jgi:hypothetical protein
MTSPPAACIGQFIQVRSLLAGGTRLRQPHGVTIQPRSNAPWTTRSDHSVAREQRPVVREERLGVALGEAEAVGDPEGGLTVEHAEVDGLVPLPDVPMFPLRRPGGRRPRPDRELHVAVRCFVDGAHRGVARERGGDPELLGRVVDEDQDVVG